MIIVDTKWPTHKIIILRMMQKWQKKKAQFPVLAFVFLIFILCSIFYNERYIHQIHQENSNNNHQITNLVDAYDNNPFNHFNHTLDELPPGQFTSHCIHTCLMFLLLI